MNRKISAPNENRPDTSLLQDQRTTTRPFQQQQQQQQQQRLFVLTQK